MFVLLDVFQKKITCSIKESGVESLVEALVENTTVIAVNVADSDGSLLAKPTDASVTRTPSNRSTADAKDVLLKVLM